MSLFEDTSNDEALARALQEEFDKEFVPRQEPALPPGTVLFTNTVPGPSVPSKKKHGTHTSGILQPGMSGYETQDIRVQHILASLDDAESEELEDEYYDKPVFDNSQANQHFAAEDITLSSKEPKYVERPSGSAEVGSDDGADTSAEADDGNDEEFEEEISFKTQRKLDRFHRNLSELEKRHAERQGFVRITCIRNTNATEQKMKCIPFPRRIQDILKLANQAFKATGKKKFTKIFTATGDELIDVNQLHPTADNVLYFSCGEDWGLKKTVWKTPVPSFDAESLPPPSSFPPPSLFDSSSYPLSAQLPSSEQEEDDDESRNDTPS